MYQKNICYHIFNQGNNRQPIFYSERNYHYFLLKMQRHLLPNARLIAYCLMPNHFHWLLQPSEFGLLLANPRKAPRTHFPVTAEDTYQQNLSKHIGILLRSYTRGLNKELGRTGSLFRRNTNRKAGWELDPGLPLPDDLPLTSHAQMVYVTNCYHYIHDNPVQAGLVGRAADWPFSSAREYANPQQYRLCDHSLTTSLLLPQSGSSEISY